MDIFYLDWVICSQLNLRTISLFLWSEILEKLVTLIPGINLSKKLLCHSLFDENLFGNFDIKLNDRFLRGVDVTSPFLVFHTKVTVNTGLKELVKW